jgi:hypothetical protein
LLARKTGEIVIEVSMVEDPQIKDIKSIQRLLQDQKNFSTMRTVLPLLSPLLKILKVDVSKINNVLERAKQLEPHLLEMAYLPDKFNDVFAELGWIMYEMLEVDIAKRAIELANTGNIELAETELANYYTPEKIKLNLLTLHGVEAFHPRIELANKALTDYAEERYHACVPVVLALLDGMVNEIHGKQKGLRRGFSSDASDLEAWDSIAAHSKGLNQLKSIFNTGRYSTISEQITIPYRNGILHGMDLGYGNKIVAAKTWAALFAAREWALKAEAGLLEAQPEVPEKTWTQLLKDIVELDKTKKAIDQFSPTEHVYDDGVIISDNNEFGIDTPEYVVAQFLLLWKKNNYGKMGGLVSIYMNGKNPKGFPSKIRTIYRDKSFLEFKITSVIKKSLAIILVVGTVKYTEHNNLVSQKSVISVLEETTDGNISVRQDDITVWRILDMNIFE